MAFFGVAASTVPSHLAGCRRGKHSRERGVRRAPEELRDMFARSRARLRAASILKHRLKDPEREKSNLKLRSHAPPSW